MQQIIGHRIHDILGHLRAARPIEVRDSATGVDTAQRGKARAKSSEVSHG
jgi:hypothetical protein